MKHRIKFSDYGIDWDDSELTKKVKDAVYAVSRAGANMVAKDARSLAPWDTGNLATSIEVKKSKYEDGGFIVQAQGPGNYGRYYAMFVELGAWVNPYGKFKKESFMTGIRATLSKSRNKLNRVYIEAQPYLRPALQKNQRQIFKMFQEAMSKL